MTTIGSIDAAKAARLASLGDVDDELTAGADALDRARVEQWSQNAEHYASQPQAIKQLQWLCGQIAQAWHEARRHERRLAARVRSAEARGIEL